MARDRVGCSPTGSSVCCAQCGHSELSLTFPSDPLGGNSGIRYDTKNETARPTEHVMMPHAVPAETRDITAFILGRGSANQAEGGAEYAKGKTLLRAPCSPFTIVSGLIAAARAHPRRSIRLSAAKNVDCPRPMTQQRAAAAGQKRSSANVCGRCRSQQQVSHNKPVRDETEGSE
jgi:hypothetical protein